MCTARIKNCLRANHPYVSDEERESLLPTESNSCQDAGDIACAIGAGVAVGTIAIGGAYLVSAAATSGCIQSTAVQGNHLCPPAETCAQVFNPCLMDNVERSVGFNLLWGLFSFAGCCAGYKSAQRMYDYRRNGCDDNQESLLRTPSPSGLEP